MASKSSATTCRGSGRSSSPASAATLRRSSGQKNSYAFPVIDHYWQTETGWPVAANCIGIERSPVIPGSPTKAVPGWDLRVLDEGGAERQAGEIRWAFCSNERAPCSRL